MEMKSNQMKKPMMIMLIAVGILFGGIFLYKGVMAFFLQQYIAKRKSPVVTVSTIKADYALWQPKIRATGTIRPVQGVNVTAQVGGMVTAINFDSGASVKEGDVLLQQNADPDIAQLHSLQANAKLAELTFNRDKIQFKVHAVSQQQLDTDEQNLKSLNAQVAQQAATVALKTITAPFTGKVGISTINVGQYLNPGDKVVSLQTFDPIYIDFLVPQQALAQLKVGQDVTVTVDVFPGKHYTGKVTTIDVAVDTNTRNINIEGTIANPAAELNTGMFAIAEVNTSAPQKYLTLPQAAVSFNSYGDIVYIVKESGEKDAKGKPVFIAKQSFVTTGEARGDQVIILHGLKAGDRVVTSGQLKLKNGDRVVINNSVQPANNPMPKAPDEHEG
ncbi:MAG: hypothetical protein ACD_45C00004G0003 [uncultured bacterium]|nr:MAG: hypothetical protein ACD_45C00004G0003 [uncultured bacterium]